MIFGLLILLAVIGVLAGLGVRAWRNSGDHDDDGGLDLIPYLILALAVGVAGFSLARLARVGLSPDRFAGRPTGEIAGALAGLVVAAPIAYFLWRRQAKRRRAHPQSPGWPIYLAVIELVFLTAFFAAVGELADALTSTALTAGWPNLVVYGGLVAFHWWAERHEPTEGNEGELPRLVGSSVSLISLTVGAIGTLTWLFSEAYEAIGSTIDVPEPAIPLALTLVAAPVWSWRWLPAWLPEAGIFRNLYLSTVTAVSATAAIGAGVTLVAVLLSYLVGQGGRAETHFRAYPATLAVLIVAGAIWIHHRRRLGVGRTGALVGYQYAMAAVGIAGLVASTVALIEAVFQRRLAGSNTGQVLIALGCTVIASGATWHWFWRKTREAPREFEIHLIQRRLYLIGMAVITGLTAAGALIGSLVVIFRAVLGENDAIVDSLRLPLSLTVVSGLAAWHLFTQVRADGAELKRTEVKPFTVTIVCSHPGKITALFPREATTRILYRGDASGIVDDAMAAAIVAEVGPNSSLVWVDDSGYKIAPARES
ncbi:MAG: DUF5671 domain-containing protein [Acidimicrobiia bacterium]